MKKIYLALAILGFLLPMSQLLPFLRAHGPDLGAFLALPFANPASSMFALDLLASCAAFWAFVFASPVPRKWLYVVLTLMVGLSFALPLFLYAREEEAASRTLLCTAPAA